MAARIRAILLFTLLFGTSPLAFTAEPLSEAQIKVAFVYNFAKFTVWPATIFSTPQSPLTLCIINNKKNNIENPFSSIEGKLVQGRALQLKRIDHIEELKNCQLVYLSENDEKSVDDVLRLLRDAPVLTISDIDDFINDGGMIGLVATGSNIQFEVNMDVARRTNMNFSAQLLKLAKNIKDSQAKGKN